MAKGSCRRFDWPSIERAGVFRVPRDILTCALLCTRLTPQRWTYPTDKKRVNEFGQYFEEDEAKEVSAKLDPPGRGGNGGSGGGFGGDGYEKGGVGRGDGAADSGGGSGSDSKVSRDSGGDSPASPTTARLREKQRAEQGPELRQTRREEMLAMAKTRALKRLDAMRRAAEATERAAAEAAAAEEEAAAGAAARAAQADAGEARAGAAGGARAAAETAETADTAEMADRPRHQPKRK